MSEVVDLLLSRLDCESPVFAGDEVARWPVDLRRAMRHSGFLSAASSTQWIECDGCGDAPVCKVLWITSPAGSRPRAYISCPECGRVRIHRQRLRRCQVHPGKLAPAVASAFGLGENTTELVPDRLWFLGKQEVVRRTREVFLARGAFWGDAREVVGHAPRLVTGTNPIVVVAGTLPHEDIWSGNTPQVVSLSSLMHWVDEGLQADHSHWSSITSGGRPRPVSKKVRAFKSPPGARWEDLILRFQNGNVLTICMNGIEEERTHVEMDMFKGRGRSPTVQWGILRGFRDEGGQFTWRNPFADRAQKRKNPKRIERLVLDLKKVFPTLEGRPILYDKKAKGWIARFKVTGDLIQA